MAIFLMGLLFTGLLALLYAAGELVVPRPNEKNRLLAGAFTCLAVLMLHGYALLGGLLVHAPLLLGWHVPFLLALGPLLYRFIEVRLDLAPGRIRSWWLHLVPAAVLMPLLIAYNAQHIEEHRAFIRQFGITRLAGEMPYLIVLSTLHFAGYVLAGAWRVGASLRWRLSGADRTVRITYYILAIAALIAVLVMTGLLSRHPGYVAASLLLLGLLLPSLYLIRQRVPSFFQDLEAAVRKEKYRNSQLRGADLTAIDRTLDRLMHEERLYRRDDLTLAALAERVGLTPHQLSEYFNNHRSLNFAGFVNRHRVAEAGELLLAEPDLTVLTIAYRVGFNSKSSFNTAFARETGVSPSRYRKTRGRG